jgi:hypothetical protein
MIIVDNQQAARSMPPTTIAEHKAALMRLGITLPTGQVSLAEYKRLYASATGVAASATPAKRKVTSESNAASSIARRRTDAGPSSAPLNVPLSQQRKPTPANVPLSYQPPPAALAPPAFSPPVRAPRNRAAPRRAPAHHAVAAPSTASVGGAAHGRCDGRGMRGLWSRCAG